VVLWQAEDEYMISDVDLFVNKYISVPRDMGQLNCAAFVAGIVKGVVDSAGFPARWVVPRVELMANPWPRKNSSALQFCQSNLS
jgi:trafficking protein particle complex subunit 5